MHVDNQMTCVAPRIGPQCLTGYVSEFSNMHPVPTLHLERGATLRQCKRMDDYDPPQQACFVRMTGSRFVFLHGRDVQHVAIVGGGTINGNLALDR